MSNLINTKALIAGAASAGIALFSAGSVAGYFYAKKKLIVQYDEQMEREIDAVREHYKKRNKIDEFATPVDAAQSLGVVVSDATIDEAEAVLEEEKAAEALESYKGKTAYQANGVVVDPVSGEILDRARRKEIIAKNVFELNPVEPVDFNYDDEIEARTASKPYVISEQEYEDNDHDHEQITITWYEGDRTLADPNDGIVALVEETVGHDNLRFGHRSNDNDLVYIRHEHYRLDMKVVRHEGKYGEIVAGFVGAEE